MDFPILGGEQSNSAPDIYDTGFKSWCAQYAMPLRPQDGGKALTQHPSPVTLKNRLFIPESRCCENSGVRALYAFGEHQALGFSPFAIDQATPSEAASVTNAYHLLRQVYSIIHLPSSIIHHPSPHTASSSTRQTVSASSTTTGW